MPMSSRALVPVSVLESVFSPASVSVSEPVFSPALVSVSEPAFSPLLVSVSEPVFSPASMSVSELMSSPWMKSLLEKATVSVKQFLSNTLPSTRFPPGIFLQLCLHKYKYNPNHWSYVYKDWFPGYTVPYSHPLFLLRHPQNILPSRLNLP